MPVRSLILAAGVALVLACGDVRPHETNTATAPIEPVPPPRCANPHDPSAASLRGLLASADYPTLEAELLALEEAARSDHACEFRVWTSYERLEKGQTSIAPLDAWVAAHPKSYAALTTRGLHLVTLGFAARGPRLAKDTPQESFDRMKAAFERASADLGAAISLEPHRFPAYGGLMDILRAAGPKSKVAPVLDALLEHDPLNFGLRRRAIDALQPRWGGSLEAVREIAESAQAYRNRYPRLQLLLGFPHAFEADEASRTKRWDDAIASYERALGTGDYWRWFDALIRVHLGRDDYASLARVATRAIDAYPDWAVYHYWRGHAQGRMGLAERAIADLERAAELNPRDPWALRSLAFNLKRTGRFEDAKHIYERLLALAPDDADAMRALAKLLAGSGDHRRAREVYGKLLELPDNKSSDLFGLAEALAALADPSAEDAFRAFLERADRGQQGELERIAKAKRFLDPAGAEASGSTLRGLSLLDSPHG